MTSVPGLPEAASVARLAGKRVLVVGDVMLDAYLIGDADRISPEAPVPVVRVESERRLLGGAGNVARNIAALGGTATLVGTVGDDASAEQVRRLLGAEGICPALVTLPGRPTSADAAAGSGRFKSFWTEGAGCRSSRRCSRVAAA